MQKFNKMVESSDKLALKEHTPNKVELKYINIKYSLDLYDINL